MGKCLKNTHKKKIKNKNKKQIKNSKLSLQLFLMANFDRVNGIRYESLEKTPILEYHKIGP
jgi:hypothetical protein